MKTPQPLLAITCLLASACGGREAVVVDAPVVVDTERMAPFQTDLGYQITVTSARTAIADLQFTMADSPVDESASAWLWNQLIPTAHAHPGHGGDGEVTGELLGSYVVDWLDDGALVGTAAVLTGQYGGANFLFRAAEASEGLEPGDALVGHTMYLEATARRDGESWGIALTLDLDPGNPLLGAPFAVEITETESNVIELELAPLDPFEGDTVFDGIDFATLDADGDRLIEIGPGQALHNQIRRAFAAHDHYFLDSPRSTQ